MRAFPSGSLGTRGAMKARSRSREIWVALIEQSIACVTIRPAGFSP